MDTAFKTVFSSRLLSFLLYKLLTVLILTCYRFANRNDPPLLGIFRSSPLPSRPFPPCVAICFLVLLQSPCCCSRWRGGGVAWRGLLRVGQNKSGAPEAREWRRESVSVRTERCPGHRETRLGCRKSRSGWVRPEGNKEIMAPRCVCSRMEGGEAAAVGVKHTKYQALREH